MRAMFRPAGVNLADPTAAFKGATNLIGGGTGGGGNTHLGNKGDYAAKVAQAYATALAAYNVGRTPQLIELNNTTRALRLLNEARADLGLNALDRMPHFTSEPVFEKEGFYKQQRYVAPAVAPHVNDRSDPYHAPDEPPPPQGRDHAECDRVWNLLTAEQRADIGVRDRFCRANPGCCNTAEEARIAGGKTEAELRLENCERLIAAITPAQQNDLVFMTAFATANPTCVDRAAPATPPTPPIAPECHVPTQFASDAEKLAYITANPACLTQAASVRVVTTHADTHTDTHVAEEKDYTVYYIAGGVAAAVLIAGTAAYFMLREPKEE